MLQGKPVYQNYLTFFKIFKREYTLEGLMNLVLVYFLV